jgi:hypothetical protein
MAISVTCDCGKRLNVKDEMLGMRVRCPACKSSLDVAAATNGNGRASRKLVSKGNGRKTGGKKVMLVAAGFGVLVLGFCCLGVGGVGAWWVFLRGSSQDSRIVGKWIADVESPKKGSVPKSSEDFMKFAFAGDIEFKADGTVIDNTPMTPITQGKWKTVSTKGDVITVELSQTPISKKLDIKVVDSDHLKITPHDLKTEVAFKRVP